MDSIQGKIFLIVGPMLVASLFVIAMNANIKASKKMDRNDFTVRQPKFLIWLSIIFALALGAAFVLTVLFPDVIIADLGLYIFFALLFLLFAAYALYCLSWQIRVKGNEIRFSALFLCTKTFTFDDITTISESDIMPFIHMRYPKTTLYLKRRKLLTIYSYYTGYNMFVARLNEWERPEDWGEWEAQEDIEEPEDWEEYED